MSNPIHENAKCLLIMAHGSRAQQANDEFAAIVEKMKPLLASYQHVEAIFLELCEPSMKQAVEKNYQLGFRKFDIYPMFFNKGKHVGVDIPNQIDACLAEFKNTDIKQLDYFGSFDSFAGSMVKHIEQQLL